MTIKIRLEENGAKKVTYDDLNPRIYLEEWKCKGCKTLVVADEVVWAMPDGTLSTDKGDPYCVECVPDEGADA